MEKEILYKIVLDWYNDTVVGADGFDEEWDEICDSIEYRLREQINLGQVETVEELIESGKKMIGNVLGDREALKFEKIAKDSYDPYDSDKEYEQIVKDSLKEGKSKMRVNEGLFDPKPWSARGIEKAKKGKQLPPHRYSVHMTDVNVEQLFGLMAMQNIKKGVELFGFGLAKIEGRYFLYRWEPAEINWRHPKMGLNKLTKQSSEITLNRLSTDFTDDMADDLSHWIEYRELMGVCSGRMWPIFNFKNYGEVYEGIMVFGNDASSIHKYKKLYNKLTNGKNALPIESDNYTGDISEIPNNFQMGSYLSVDLDPEEIMSLGIGQKDNRDETARKPYGEVTLDESEKSFPGLKDYMKNDVENIFNHNPDMSMDYFLNSVTGEGDEGYDPECTAIMWEYYEYLQSR